MAVNKVTMSHITDTKINGAFDPQALRYSHQHLSQPLRHSRKSNAIVEEEDGKRSSQPRPGDHHCWESLWDRRTPVACKYTQSFLLGLNPELLFWGMCLKIVLCACWLIMINPKRLCQIGPSFKDKLTLCLQALEGQDKDIIYSHYWPSSGRRRKCFSALLIVHWRVTWTGVKVSRKPAAVCIPKNITLKTCWKTK